MGRPRLLPPSERPRLSTAVHFPSPLAPNILLHVAPRSMACCCVYYLGLRPDRSFCTKSKQTPRGQRRDPSCSSLSQGPVIATARGVCKIRVGGHATDVDSNFPLDDHVPESCNHSRPPSTVSESTRRRSSGRATALPEFQEQSGFVEGSSVSGPDPSVKMTNSGGALVDASSIERVPKSVVRMCRHCSSACRKSPSS